MQAFHNSPEIKATYLARVKAHAAADEIIKGQYWKNGKGCAVGCTVHSGNHAAYETELGIPQIIARLEDRIFENIPNELAMTWPVRFLEAIKPGADLSKVWPKFAIFLLMDPTQCNARHPQCITVSKAFQSELNGESVNWPQVRSAADAAYAAYASAADAAAYASAYASAVYAEAADAAAYAAANRTNAYIAQSEKLLQLLSEAK